MILSPARMCERPGDPQKAAEEGWLRLVVSGANGRLEILPTTRGRRATNQGGLRPIWTVIASQSGSPSQRALSLVPINHLNICLILMHRGEVRMVMESSTSNKFQLEIGFLRSLCLVSVIQILAPSVIIGPNKM